MKGLELKIPPGALLLIAFSMIAACRHLLPGWSAGSPGLRRAATILAALGAGIALSGMVSFQRVGTTVNPLKPEGSTKLVVHGVYRFTRNPMYLGMSLLVAAAAVASAHPLSIPVAAAFVWFLDRFQIRPEEVQLRKLFGSEYEAYTRRVRRWI